MLDNLVQMIIKRLTLRETTTLNLLPKELSTSQTPLFLKAKTIRIQQVDQLFLDAITKGSCNEITKWLGLANAYGVTIQLELFDLGEPWLCYEQLVHLPYSVYTPCNQLLYHVPEAVICYQDVALLTNQHTLCTYETQQLTALAQEHLQKHRIERRERT